VAVLLVLGAAGSGAGVLASRSPPLAPPAGPRAGAKAPDAGPAPPDRPPQQVVRAAHAPVRQPLRPPLTSKAADLASRLAKPVIFSGYDADPKMSLQEALDHLADRYDLSFDVNEAAFKADRVNDVMAHPVAAKAVPKMVNVRLDRVLRKVLERVPARSGATFLIRDDHIELTTGAAVRAELGRDDRRPLPPLVYVELDEVPLHEALRQVAAGTGYGVVLDPRVGDRSRVSVTATLPNVPVDTAVRVLADMAGLKPVRLDNVLYVTLPENAARLQAEQERPPPAPAQPKKAGGQGGTRSPAR
jgi:hypothetical protein